MPGFLVTHDELLEDHGFHHWDINSPLPEPLSALNDKKRVVLSVEHESMIGTGITIGCTGNGGTDFHVETSAFEDFHYGGKGRQAHFSGSHVTMTNRYDQRVEAQQQQRVHQGRHQQWQS